MAMGIGINVQDPDDGVVNGVQEDVACGVWFTSQGIVTPKMLKYKCDDGSIQQLTDFHVISCAKKNYCGIPSITYNCYALINDKKYLFDLHYYIETSKWTILWKDS